MGSRLVANMVILVGLCWVPGCVGGIERISDGARDRQGERERC